MPTLATRSDYQSTNRVVYRRVLLSLLLVLRRITFKIALAGAGLSSDGT